MEVARVPLVLVLLGALAACKPGAPVPARRAHDCPRAARVLQGAEFPARVDLDGDGRADPVTAVADPGARPGCRALVAGRVGGRVLSTGVDSPAVDVGTGLPALQVATELDGERGEELVVDVASGAATVFAAVVSLEDGRLALLKSPFAGYGGLFPHGGSAAHIDGVDCLEGSLWATSARSVGRSYAVLRRRLEVRAGAFEVVSRRRFRAPLQEVAGRAPELEGVAFGRC